MMHSRRQAIAVMAICLAICPARFSSIASAETIGNVDYHSDIKPLLVKKCASCHGALGQKAGLRLDAGSFILAGGEEGPVVTPGSAATSRLIERVSSDDVDYRMPPDGEGESLEGEQIALLSAWIDAGASVPDDEPIPANPRDHWAFQQLVRPPIPVVGDTEINNPIDAFV
ncbi:MAG: c-type cytochrome domain-containing protein, partial [Bythopirellula sp.]